MKHTSTAWMLSLVLFAATAMADRKVKYIEPEPADRLHPEEKVLSMPVVDTQIAGPFKGFGPTVIWRPFNAYRVSTVAKTRIKDRTIEFSETFGFAYPAVREKEGFKVDETSVYLVQEGDTLFRDEGKEESKLTEIALVARDGRVILKRHELIYQVSVLVDDKGVWRRSAGRLLVVPMKEVLPAPKEDKVESKPTPMPAKGTTPEVVIPKEMPSTKPPVPLPLPMPKPLPKD